MNKMSIFGKDCCLRLLDTLSKFMLKDLKEFTDEQYIVEARREAARLEKHGPGFLGGGQTKQQSAFTDYVSLFEKLLDQLQASSSTMNERNICRTFSVLNRQLKFGNLKEEDVERVKVRTQFFLDKLVDIL